MRASMMARLMRIALMACVVASIAVGGRAQEGDHDEKGHQKRERRERGHAKGHPDSSKWAPLFKADLSDAATEEGVWTFTDGVLTASADRAIWSKVDHENFVFDLEFKTADGTNSGVIVYCTDTEQWIPNSVEVQIADDYSKKWSEQPATWHCGAIFGHLAPKESAVKKPGAWNRMTITCKGQQIDVVLNEKHVTSMDMSLWTSATTNPDGSEIPSWLSNAFSKLSTKGKIGLQGKHAEAPIWFRNVKIKAVDGK